MLQQTQVTTVIPYYQRFLKRFPSVTALAQADADAVLAAWSGLGYYSRARNLHRAAALIAARGWPEDLAGLSALPGVGESTAAAIATFCFGRREAILDGNVRRVYQRYLGIEAEGGDPRSRASSERLWACARAVMADPALPDDAAPTLIQGLMDLGASLCSRSRPRCEPCPLAPGCVTRRLAQAGDRAGDLRGADRGGERLAERLAGSGSGAAAERTTDGPAQRKTGRDRKAGRRPLPWRQYRLLLIRTSAVPGVWLERRRDGGLWGGLWSLPELGAAQALGADGQLLQASESLDLEQAIAAHLAALQTAWPAAGVVATAARSAAPAAMEAGVKDAGVMRAGFDHTFTHFRMRACIHAVQVDAPGSAAPPGGAQRLDDVGAVSPWVWLPLTAAAIDAAPLATPIRALLLRECAAGVG